MNIPDAAIEAAAEAIDRHDDWYATDDGAFICDGCRTVLGNESAGVEPHEALYAHRALAAIEAAEPYIRDALAQEIEGIRTGLFLSNHGVGVDRAAAARIARGGTP